MSGFVQARIVDYKRLLQKFLRLTALVILLAFSLICYKNQLQMVLDNISDNLTRRLCKYYCSIFITPLFFSSVFFVHIHFLERFSFRECNILMHPFTYQWSKTPRLNVNIIYCLSLCWTVMYDYLIASLIKVATFCFSISLTMPTLSSFNLRLNVSLCIHALHHLVCTCISDGLNLWIGTNEFLLKGWHSEK